MNTKTYWISSVLLPVVATDHPDLVGGIVWSRCELDWINNRLSDAEAIITNQAERIKEIEARCAELEKRNSAWRNGGYTSLWKQRTEDRDRTIESQRLTLMDLRDKLAAAARRSGTDRPAVLDCDALVKQIASLYVHNEKSEAEWEQLDSERVGYMNDVGDVLGQNDTDESLINAARRERE